MIKIYDHVKAVHDYLKAEGWRVYLGDVRESSPRMPYVLVRMAAGTPKTTTVYGVEEDLQYLQPITTVAPDPTTLLRVLDDVRATLDGHVFTIPGRHAEPLRLSYSSGAFTDDQVNLTGGGHPSYAVDMWQMTTHP